MIAKLASDMMALMKAHLFFLQILKRFLYLWPTREAAVGQVRGPFVAAFRRSANSVGTLTFLGPADQLL